MEPSNRCNESHTAGGYQRPGRYVGREWNRLDQTKNTPIRAVLVYPDIYEIGMSHYGLQLLFSILSHCDDVIVDRVFLPWPDYEAFLTSHHLPLVSLDLRLPLSSFDFILITLPHEMAYTNVLNLIQLAGIPLRQSERKRGSPIVIGGGICALNPIPLVPFFDAFSIGDADRSILEIASTIRKAGGKDGLRDELLQALADVEGMLVPSIHNLNSNNSILKSTLDSLDTAPFPSPYLTPIFKTVHNRVVVEAARGCPRKCRFCQARVYYGPIRHRSPDAILNIAQQGIVETGFDEVSLLALSIADYPGIENLLVSLMNVFRKKSVSLSLPSLRPEKLTPRMIEQIRHVRKSGFTLAPEAGSDRLRSIIGKPYDTDRLLSGVTSIFQAGWSTLKLYFMAGQPFEMDSDIDSIADLVRQIHSIGRKIQGRRTDIHVSVSAFIPKPHTPFQWSGQAPRDTLHARMRELRHALRMPGIKLSYSDIAASRIEALLARGNDRVANVVENAFFNGCRFDSWVEAFKEPIWLQAIADAGIDLEQEVTRPYSTSEVLPWACINPGLPIDELKTAYHSAEVSADEDPSSVQEARPQPIDIAEIPRVKPEPDHQNETASEPGATCFALFRIVNDFRLFGHLDIAAELLRAARRAGLPLAYSQGFNPHARFSFSPPTPLGFEHFFEPIEFVLLEKIDEHEILLRLNQCIDHDMGFRTVKIRQPNEVSLMKRLKSATYGFAASSLFDLDPIRSSRPGIILWNRNQFLSRIDVSLRDLIPLDYTVFALIQHGKPNSPKTSDLLASLNIDPDRWVERPVAARLWWNEDENGAAPLVRL